MWQLKWTVSSCTSGLGGGVNIPSIRGKNPPTRVARVWLVSEILYTLLKDRMMMNTKRTNSKVLNNC